MAEVSLVLIKDLLSTGYFFEELKNHSKSAEMDFFSYSRDYAIPYLTKLAGSNREMVQSDSRKIISFACETLSDASDDELIDVIFGLKEVAASEIEINEKMLSRIGQHDKSQVSSCHRKADAARSLLKLLVNIVRMFKLAEIIAKQDRSEGTRDSVGDAIKHKWQVLQQSA